MGDAQGVRTPLGMPHLHPPVPALAPLREPVPQWFSFLPAVMELLTFSITG